MKKIKKVGIGALALCCVLSFSACKPDLNNDQVDRIMSALDSSERFMENQSKKLNLEDAYNLYDLAYTSFKLNVNGIRDNVVLEYQFVSDDSDEVETLRMFFYKEESNNYAFMQIDSDSTIIVFEDRQNSDVYRYYTNGGFR